MPKYYDDLLAAAEKDVSSRNFCTLVDAAVTLSEAEHRLLPDKGKSKCFETVSEVEQASGQQRFFPLVPRKRRTSLMESATRRNLNDASTSLLRLDLTAIPADFETEDPQSPRFCKPEMTNFPPESNSESSPSSCLTEKTIRTKRAVEQPQRKRSDRESKKAKVFAGFSWIGRETPVSLVQLMRDVNKSDLKLIFERTLFKTDVNPVESRLSMPYNHLIRIDFLSHPEWRIIKEDINNGNKTGVGAILFDQRNVKWGVILKRWESSGNGSWHYALTCGWNDIVKANGLKDGDHISIWSFRWLGVLCFALVTPPTTMEHSRSLNPCSTSLSLASCVC